MSATTASAPDLRRLGVANEEEQRNVEQSLTRRSQNERAPPGAARRERPWVTKSFSKGSSFKQRMDNGPRAAGADLRDPRSRQRAPMYGENHAISVAGTLPPVSRLPPPRRREHASPRWVLPQAVRHWPMGMTLNEGDMAPGTAAVMVRPPVLLEPQPRK